MKYLLPIFTVLILISCERELIIGEVGFTKQVVINSILNPDSTYVVNLSYTKPRDSNDGFDYVDDAKVQIMDVTTQRFFHLSYSGNGDYKLGRKPNPTHEYELEIVTLENKIISAYTIIPDDIQYVVSVDTLFDSNNEFESLNIDIDIENNPDTDEFYTFEIFPYQRLITNKDSLIDPIEFLSTEQSLELSTDGRFESNFKTLIPFSDIGHGNSISETFNVGSDEIKFITAESIEDESGNSGTGDNGTETQNEEQYEEAYAIRIRAVSAQLFDYFNSTELAEAQANDSFGSNISSPAIIMYNITNGLGVFGGSNTVVLPIN